MTEMNEEYSDNSEQEYSEEAQEPDEQQASEEEESSGNPAWQEFLDVLPTELHSIVRPVLEKWDRGVQERFQAIHKEYEPYRTYDPLVEHGIPLQSIEQGLQIIQGLESNPQKVYEAIGKFYNITPAQAEAAVESQRQAQIGEDFDKDTGEYVDPRVAQLQKQVGDLTNIMYQRYQAEQQAQQDQALAQEMQRLAEQYGEFDENYVLSLMLQNITPEDAVQYYHSMVEQIRQDALQETKSNAPRVLGSGSGPVGSKSVNPGELSDSATKQLVAQMLERAARSE